MEWRSENWIVDSAQETPTGTGSLAFTDIVRAVNNTIDKAEEYAGRPSTDMATADKLKKQVGLLRNAAARFVTIGSKAHLGASAAELKELDEADLILAAVHRDLLKMITNLLPQRTEVSKLVTGDQAVIAEMTTAAYDLLAWQNKEDDIKAFPSQFDEVFNRWVTAMTTVITDSLSSNPHLQLEVAEALQEVSERTEEMIDLCFQNDPEPFKPPRDLLTMWNSIRSLVSKTKDGLSSK